MKTVGDKILISPDLTQLSNWIEGTIIEVENNPFVGVVISAETEDGNVFFGKEDLFKPQNPKSIKLVKLYRHSKRPLTCAQIQEYHSQ